MWSRATLAMVVSSTSMIVASITATAISHLFDEGALICGGAELSEGAAAMTNQKPVTKDVAEAARPGVAMNRCKGRLSAAAMRTAAFIKASRMPNNARPMQPKTRVEGHQCVSNLTF